MLRKGKMLNSGEVHISGQVKQWGERLSLGLADICSEGAGRGGVGKETPPINRVGWAGPWLLPRMSQCAAWIHSCLPSPEGVQPTCGSLPDASFPLYYNAKTHFGWLFLTSPPLPRTEGSFLSLIPREVQHRGVSAAKREPASSSATCQFICLW
jgi:hypothetical protein